MDQLLKNSGLPERHLINDEVMAATARQIEKDLRLGSLDFSTVPAGQPAFDRLFGALLPTVRELLSDGVAALPQKLYQVDLPEKYVNAGLTNAYPAEFLTEAIIKRCFQKVVLRRLYSQGKNE